MDDTTFAMEGYAIDLDERYRAMHAQSVLEGGIRVFHGNSNDVRAVKRLLHELFGPGARHDAPREQPHPQGG